MTEASQDDKPLVVLIGNVDREGVLSAIAQSGRWYKRKDLHSMPANWQSIVDILTQSSVSAALMQMTPFTYRYIVHEDYASIREQLFEHLAEVPHSVFIHDDLFHGTREGELSEEFDYPTEDQRKSVCALLDRYGINVVTYQKNSEVTLLVLSFLATLKPG